MIIFPLTLILPMLVTKKVLNVPYSKYDQIQSSLRKKRREILVFLEHSSCITGGINYNIKNLLVSEEFLKNEGIDFCLIKRGGDLTAHEKGQLVIYPHVDLTKRNLSIKSYLDMLLGTIQNSIQKIWSLELVQKFAEPGLFLKHAPEKKLVSVGVHFKSFFTSFGASFNVKNDLKTFSYINPCGKKSSDIVSIKSLGLEFEKEGLFLKEFRLEFLNRLQI